LTSPAISTAAEYVNAPLIYSGKVRELYDLGEHMLIAVTDRISAFDYVLKPAIPGKGKVLNSLSRFWFKQTRHLQANHFVHADVEKLRGVINNPDVMKDRVMVVKKAQRIDMECIVRGYITGSGWREYVQSGTVHGQKLPAGLRKNEKLAEPIFTPSTKNDSGHDENISVEQMADQIGADLTRELMERSLRLYRFAHDVCRKKGVILADCKLEFGILDGEIILIDELFTPDSSRFWAEDRYELDIDIDSMDKEPVRTYLAGSGWDKNSEPDPLPQEVVDATARRYREIYERLTGQNIGVEEH
jgi:phosphoribosylaminoimidazole-succinocarboxamide synthase